MDVLRKEAVPPIDVENATCGKSHKVKTAFEKHKLSCVSYKNKSFVCHKCGKELSSKKNLYNHDSTAHADRHFECVQRGKSFNKQAYSVRYTNHVHLHVNICSCHICGKVLSSSMPLQRHVKSRHEGLTEFDCTQCEYKSGDPKLLKSHVKSAHMDIIHHRLKSTSIF